MMKLFLTLLLFLAPWNAVSSSLNCSASDQAVADKMNMVCSSLGSGGIPAWCNASIPSAQKDWPNQAFYFRDLLETLASNTTIPPICQRTPLVTATLQWISNTNTSMNAWWNTWVVFQVSYYNMPRAPGERIESPATLGRKCWAFAFLAQIWTQEGSSIPGGEDLRQRLVERYQGDVQEFVQFYDAAVPMTLQLCKQVMANCFVNASYDPGLRNGTCPDSVGEFYVGYSWENGNNNVQNRSDRVDYPFPGYNQTAAWRQSIQFAVNTALNYII